MAGGLAIVLSGGGAKGAFQVGVLKALISGRQVDFETVVGTSTGAIQAAAVAQDDIPAPFSSSGPRPRRNPTGRKNTRA